MAFSRYRVWLFAFVLVTVGSGSGPRAGATRPVTIDDTLHLRAVSGTQIAPDGSRVLFTVRAWEWPGGKVEPDKGAKPPDMRSHIWMVSTGGTEPPRQITYGERGETSPNWSPDGRYISFSATRGAGTPNPDADTSPKPQIWVMRAEGGEAWALTDAKEGVGAYEWAPDSRRVACLMREPYSKEEEEARRRKDDERVFENDGRMQHLWVIDVETKAATQVTSGTDFTVSNLSWAPDGTRIVFAAKTRRSRATNGRMC